MSKEKRKVEWSFDFEDLGDRFSKFFSDVIGGDVEVNTAELIAELDGATSAIAKVDFSVGRATVVALPVNSPNLFEANITYVGEYEFEVTGEEEKRIKLRQKDRSFPRAFGGVFSKHHDLEWNLALSRNVPYSLRLKGGVGESDIDLTHLTVSKLKLETGVGKVDLTLPIQEQSIDVDINGGVGKTDINIPAGVSAQIDVRGGIGELNVTISPSSGVRVEANSGLGDVRLPKDFEHIKGMGNFIGANGVWESKNFATAQDQVVIDYKGGIGSFRLRYFELV